MCGRFTLTKDINELQQYFSFDFDGELSPRYNIAPGQQILTVISNGGLRFGKEMKWGFIPYWAKDEKIGYKMINARSETIETKPSFKYAFRKRRCLILSDGYYEWKKTDDGKIPYRFILKNGNPFAFAGIWETWNKGNKPLVTCTIITTVANEITEDVHERMPVILNEKDFNIWLNPTFENIYDLKELLKPYDSNKMERYEVSSLVNSSRNEGVELITPVE